MRYYTQTVFQKPVSNDELTYRVLEIKRELKNRILGDGYFPVNPEVTVIEREKSYRMMIDFDTESLCAD